jgi:hypothetical protein
MSAFPTRPPWWYWAVAILALVWMLFGVVAWCLDLMLSPAQLAQLPAAQQELYLIRPQWLFVVYAVAVFGGLAGAIGLLLRRRWATTFFLVSLAAIVVQFGYTFLAMHAMQVLGAAQALPFPIVIFAFGVFLLWFARYARRHGWITVAETRLPL